MSLTTPQFLGVAGLKTCARSCLTANVDVQWGNEDIIVHLGCPIRTPTIRCVCVADHLYLGTVPINKTSFPQLNPSPI